MHCIAWMAPQCCLAPKLLSTPFQQVRTALDYHIRVLIPCYKEPIDVIQKTVVAALVAPIPTNCSRTGERRGAGRAGTLGSIVLRCEAAPCRSGHLGTQPHSMPPPPPHTHTPPPPPTPHTTPLAVYLLDDGRDIEKKKFMHGLGVSNAVYIRHATRLLALTAALLVVASDCCSAFSPAFRPAT